MRAMRLSLVVLTLPIGAFAQQNGLLPSPSTVPSAPSPMTTAERLEHFQSRTFGLPGIARGLALGGIQTWQKEPEEWPANADGFSRRFGSRMGRLAVGNAVQMGVGFATKDDPRYRRSEKDGFGARLSWAVLSPFWVYDGSGHRMPAYSRFAGSVAGFMAESTWLPPSVNTPGNAMQRCGFSFGGQVAANVFREFWPDIKRKLKRN
jgi:hypothetical protein